MLLAYDLVLCFRVRNRGDWCEGFKSLKALMTPKQHASSDWPSDAPVAPCDEVTLFLQERVLCCQYGKHWAGGHLFLSLTILFLSISPFYIFLYLSHLYLSPTFSSSLGHSLPLLPSPPPSFHPCTGPSQFVMQFKGPSFRNSPHYEICRVHYVSVYLAGERRAEQREVINNFSLDKVSTQRRERRTQLSAPLWEGKLGPDRSGKQRSHKVSLGSFTHSDGFGFSSTQAYSLVWANAQTQACTCSEACTLPAAWHTHSYKELGF